MERSRSAEILVWFTGQEESIAEHVLCTGESSGGNGSLPRSARRSLHRGWYFCWGHLHLMHSYRRKGKLRRSESASAALE